MTKNEWKKLTLRVAENKVKIRGLELHQDAKKFFRKLDPYHENRNITLYLYDRNKLMSINPSSLTFKYSWKDDIYDIVHKETVTVPFNFIQKITIY